MMTYAEIKLELLAIADEMARPNREKSRKVEIDRKLDAMRTEKALAGDDYHMLGINLLEVPESNGRRLK
jgi:hypothetical protein